MPFPSRVIPKRDDIGEVFGNTTENILNKTHVSNLIGLLNQLNKVSLYANEVFTDVYNATKETDSRIKTVKTRINNIQSSVPKIENMLISNAPNHFYDNPYPGKEYARMDYPNGLLFSREDSTLTINRRRDIAKPPTDLSAMDRISQKGPCIKRFSDADFFIDEWLANEKRKREEERERRRQMKANRKKKKIKRTQNKTIQRLKKKRYDAFGNVVNDEEPAEIAVTQYVLSDDTNRDFDTLLNQKQKKKKDKKKEKRQSQLVQQPQVKSPEPAVQKSQHQHSVSYAQPNVPSKAPKVAVNGPPAFVPSKVPKSADSKPKPPAIPEDAKAVPPPNPVQAPPPNPMQAPPPNPMQRPPPNPSRMSYSETSKNKLRGISADIPMDDLTRINTDDDYKSPADIYAESYQKRDLENEQLDLSNASHIIATSPKEVAPVPPKLGFLGDIAAFKKKGKLKKTEINVNRSKPKDQRSMLLDQLRNNKVQLSSVNLRKVAPKKEEKKNLIFQAMADRRRHMEDSSSEEDSDWGSESE